ncbi:MAG: hypothetical protein ACK413_00635 [Patescibacteria group bacterium]
MAKIIKVKKALILAILFLFLIGYWLIPKSKAATILEREVRISDSRPSKTGVIYDFQGDTSASTVKCIRMRFCTSPDTSGSCTTPTGLDTTSATKETTGWNVFHPENWTINNTTNGDLKLTYATGEPGGDDSSWVVGNITNPSTADTTFYVWINTYNNTDCSSDPVDDGVVAFATVSGVEVSAKVLETLTFSVYGVAANDCPTTGGTKKTSTSTTVPFGTVDPNSFYDGCQDLRVSTNAGNGYDVTIGETDQLTSGPNQIPDGNCDGSCSETDAAPWANPNNNGFGYCMKDQPGYGNAASEADANWGTYYCGAATQYFKIIPDTGENEPRVKIMNSSSTASDDRSYIGFRLSVDAAQPAGSYSTTIVYVVTPRY